MNKINTDDTKEQDEEEIIAHELYLHHWGCCIDAQKRKNTEGAHHGGLLTVVVGCGCTPAAPDVVVLATGGSVEEVAPAAGGT